MSKVGLYPIHVVRSRDIFPQPASRFLFFCNGAQGEKGSARFGAAEPPGEHLEFIERVMRTRDPALLAGGAGAWLCTATGCGQLNNGSSEVCCSRACQRCR